MNADEMKGTAESLKGKTKQKAGDLTDDPELKSEGVADEAAGEAQRDYGTAKRKVGESVEGAGERIKE